MIVMPFVLIIQLIMSGMMFELNGVTKAISNATISKWGMNAVCASARVNELFHAPRDNASAIAEQTSTVGNLTVLWLTLIGFALIYGILAAIALSFVDNN